MNSDNGKKPSQQQYCIKGVMDFVQEQIKNSSNEWTQEKNMLIKKITELEREVKTLKKVNNNISNKVIGGLLTEANLSQNDKKTIIPKNHKRVESDTLKLNEKKLAKIRCHFMKKKLNSDEYNSSKISLQKNKNDNNIRGSKRTLSYGGFDKIFENNLFDSIHSNININTNSLKKDINLPSFRVTMYNNINLNSNNNNNFSQNSYSTSNNFPSSNTFFKKKEKEKEKEKENNFVDTNTPSNKTSISNTFETIIDNSNQNQKKEDDFLIPKIDENRGSFIIQSKKEDNGENLRISVIEKVNNTNSLITKKDPSKPSYNPIIVLKSHFDCVRGLYITSDSKYIVTVGDDMMVNTWDFKKSLYQNKEYFETYCSYRSHKKPIFSICGNNQKTFNNGYSFYTAGSDGVIFHWKIFEGINDKYDCEYEKILNNSLSLSWKAHTDSIWHLSHHSSENILSSLSSDGTVKIWKGYSEEHYIKNTFSYDSKFKPLLRQITFKNINYNFTEIPTSSAWSIRNPNSIHVSYISPFIRTYDIETGKSTNEFTYSVEKIHPFENFQANKICVSNSFGLIISGNEDRQIRFYDKNQSKCIKNMVAHTDSVSSVCIGNEEYQLLSCSHDGSFRCWDIRKYKLLFDVPAHRKKNDEGCISILANSSYHVIITSGADGLVKIFKNS